MYGKPVIRKPQLEKEEFRLQEERPNLPAHLKNRGFYLQYNYNPLFYKTYRIDYYEYYLGTEEGNQLTESKSN
jgi:hypothetical protein